MPRTKSTSVTAAAHLSKHGARYLRASSYQDYGHHVSRKFALANPPPPYGCRPFSSSSSRRRSKGPAGEVDAGEKAPTLSESGESPRTAFGGGKAHTEKKQEPKQEQEQELGAMSRRLAAASEDAVLEGGRAGQKAISDAGFSEELKQKLLERVVEAQRFPSSSSSSISTSENVGGAAAVDPAWTGTESTSNAVLRMLDDAHKPLKPGLRARGGGGATIQKPVVDLRLRRETKRTSGQRLANARDKTSIYAITKDTHLSAAEQSALRQELKERFGPGARATATMPTSFQGLAALANERIEDAIARGQFKNIPRGKAIERDARADNPFIDTTEYIMNKMIQRQDIVPPWIEKQQELVRAAGVFRGRLRNDWKRHAARSVASRGGSLQEQVRRAERYAESERLYNPKKRAVEQISIPTTFTSDPVMVNIVQEAPSPTGTDSPPAVVQVAIETEDAEIPITEPLQIPVISTDTETTGIDTPPPEPLTHQPLPPPFRDSKWEQAELSYLTLAITSLNRLTRSYNLMAPQLAKKPYFSLERELNACYADVAPQLARAIIDRAARPPKDLVEKMGHRPGSVFERLGGETAKVYDSKKPLYGFRQFWNDLWGGEKRV